MNPYGRYGLHVLLALCPYAGLSTASAGPLAAGQFEDIHHFPEGPLPQLGEVRGQPFLAADGNLYLASATGGTKGLGAIYRMNARGDLSTVHDFTSLDNSASPNNLALGPDGNYYGAAGSSASIFQISKNGQFRAISGTGSATPYPMITGPDGALYGVATQGGVNQLGCVFRLTTTRQYSVLASFSRVSSGHLLGAYPNGSLVLGSNNNFYGIGGGEDPQVYQVTAAGQVTVAAHLPGPGLGALVKAQDGNLYGLTKLGTGNASAALFRIDPAGLYTLLATCPYLSMVPSQLVAGADGNLYTTGVPRAELDGYLFRVGPEQWTVVSNLPNAVGSLRWLVPGPGGDLYGATAQGGIANQGILFNVATTGELTTITELGSALRGPTGISHGIFNQRTLVGLTEYGGSTDLGTVFEIDEAGVFKLIDAFTGLNGSHPQGAPVFTAGSLAAVTRDGGASDRGTIVALADRSKAILESIPFDESSGQAPDSLISISGPNFSIIGTTRLGGPERLGNVFQVGGDYQPVNLLNFDTTTHPPLKLAISPDPALNGTLYGVHLGGSQQGQLFQRSGSGSLNQTAEFDSQGLSGVTSLIVAADGDLYGTADNGGGGAVFKLTPGGILTIAATFEASGQGLPDCLAQRPNGDFYGILRGKLPALGSIFRLSAAWELSTVHTFTGEAGSFPNSLTLSTDGNLCGTTRSGSLVDAATVADGGEIYRLRFGPAVITGNATPISSTSATLNAVVDPRGAATEVKVFCYPNDTGGSQSSEVTVSSLPAGSAPVPVSIVITGLKPSTYYRYRFQAINEDAGTPQYGGELGFYTRSAVAQWLDDQNLTGGVYGDDDRDGANNLLEYAFGTSPHAPQNTRAMAAGGVVVSHGAPTVLWSSEASGNVAIFARRKDRDFTGLSYAPQMSTDLNVWSEVTDAPVVLASDEDFEIVSVALPMGATGQSQRYFRLQVVSPD